MARGHAGPAPDACSFLFASPGAPPSAGGRSLRKGRRGNFRSEGRQSSASARNGGGGGGGILGSIVDRAKQVVDRVAGLAVSESAAAASRRDAAPAAAPHPFALAPLERPLIVGDDGVARVWVTCGTSFATSAGTVTLRTMPQSPDRRPRTLGSPTRFECSPARRMPVVAIELPAKDRRLVEQLGRLRVRATAEATSPAGATAEARSRFILVPDRP